MLIILVLNATRVKQAAQKNDYCITSLTQISASCNHAAVEFRLCGVLGQLFVWRSNDMNKTFSSVKIVKLTFFVVSSEHPFWYKRNSAVGLNSVGKAIQTLTMIRIQNLSHYKQAHRRQLCSVCIQYLKHEQQIHHVKCHITFWSHETQIQQNVLITENLLFFFWCFWLQMDTVCKCSPFNVKSECSAYSAGDHRPGGAVDSTDSGECRA